MTHTVPRRVVTRTLAWTAPAVAVATAAPASAVSAGTNPCSGTPLPAMWGYSIADEKTHCRGLDARGHKFNDKVDKTDTLFVRFDITAKDRAGYGVMPAGARFLLTITFSKDAYSGDKSNVKGVYVSQSSAYTVVGERSFGDRSATVAVDLARDIAPGETVQVWVRVVSENKINEKGEKATISATLEKAPTGFLDDEKTGCRQLITGVFDGDRDEESANFENVSDKDVESKKSCTNTDRGVTWVETQRVKTR